MRRWMIYALVGLIFGIVDWYFLALLAALGQNETLNNSLMQSPGLVRLLAVLLIVGANYGIWLVPVIPVALAEIKRSQAIWRAMAAAALVWSMAILAYYAYYTFLLMFVGLPHMDFMLYSRAQMPGYWNDWWPTFRRVISDQVIDWMPIAIGGGALVGGLTGAVLRFRTKGRTPITRPGASASAV